MTSQGYDLAVLGAGSAGFAAAIAGAQAGARVALVGYGAIGGTCVNDGCVPSKALIRAAEAVHGARTAHRFAGVDASSGLRNWTALRRQKDELVERLRRDKYIDLLPEFPGIRYIEGCAALARDGVQVAGDSLRAGAVVVATGARPAAPPIPGLDDVPYLTSTTAMALDRLPPSLMVLGGGYVGCELGQMFARLGVRVTILCRSRLLPEAEPEISRALTDAFKDEGITVLDGVAYDEVVRDGDGVRVIGTHDARTFTAEAAALLVATGRIPNTDGLGLDEAGVRRNAAGGISVDDRLRTTAPTVYAAGDVTGRDMYVYMAAHAGKVAALNAVDGDARRYDDRAIPAVVFTDPQAASVGLTEAAARARGHAVRTSLLPLDAVPRALAARDTRGAIKLVADAGDGRLLGAHILAPEGGDSIQTAAMAIRAGMTARELGETIFPYLTTVEGLRLAAQAFETDVSKLSCCAG